jgi:hypothetical protein
MASSTAGFRAIQPPTSTRTSVDETPDRSLSFVFSLVTCMHVLTNQLTMYHYRHMYLISCTDGIRPQDLFCNRVEPPRRLSYLSNQTAAAALVLKLPALAVSALQSTISMMRAAQFLLITLSALHPAYGIAIHQRPQHSDLLEQGSRLHDHAGPPKSEMIIDTTLSITTSIPSTFLSIPILTVPSSSSPSSPLPTRRVISTPAAGGKSVYLTHITTSRVHLPPTSSRPSPSTPTAPSVASAPSWTSSSTHLSSSPTDASPSSPYSSATSSPYLGPPPHAYTPSSPDPPRSSSPFADISKAWKIIGMGVILCILFGILFLFGTFFNTIYDVLQALCCSCARSRQPAENGEFNHYEPPLWEKGVVPDTVPGRRSVIATPVSAPGSIWSLTKPQSVKQDKHRRKWDDGLPEEAAVWGDSEGAASILDRMRRTR